MPDDTKEVIRLRVDRVQRAYRSRGRIFRTLWLVAGATIVVVGLVMTVFPGPAIVVLPIGMAMLAAQFAWARRLLNVGIERGVDAKRRVQAVGSAARLFSLLTALSLAGAVWVIVFRR